jgi:hypothetical protein
MYYTITSNELWNDKDNDSTWTVATINADGSKRVLSYNLTIEAAKTLVEYCKREDRV